MLFYLQVITLNSKYVEHQVLVKFNTPLFKHDGEISGNQNRELDNEKFFVGPFKIKQKVDTHIKVLFEYVMQDDIENQR